MRLQIAVLGAPAYKPRLQTDTIIKKNAALFLKSFTMLIASRCELDPGGWPDQPLQGLKNSKTLSDLKCHLTARAGRHRVQAVTGKAEAGQRSDLLLLKPEQDFFHFNFPNVALPAFLRTQRWGVATVAPNRC